MKNLRGFTLIELIIGITILSLLAVALLAALDPVEQFNKARDTGTRNTAMEIHNALLRYSAAKESYPAPLNIISQGVTGNATFVGLLITPGELKSGFVNSAGGETALNKIGIYRAGDGTLLTCYNPQSKQFKQASNLANIGPGAMGVAFPTLADSAACPGSTNGTGCIWCAQ